MLVFIYLLLNPFFFLNKTVHSFCLPFEKRSISALPVTYLGSFARGDAPRADTKEVLE